MFALDGCKLPSNASTEWSGTFPELQRKKQKLEAKVAQLLAEQIQTDRGQDEPPGPRASGPSRQQVRRFTLKDFHYEESLDQYICPQGKILKLLVKRVLDHGHLDRTYIAAEKDCQTCPLRSRCIYGKGGKRKHLAVPIGESLSQQMVEKIATEPGRRIYPQRLALVEPVFANIRINKR